VAWSFVAAGLGLRQHRLKTCATKGLLYEKVYPKITIVKLNSEYGF
jgi:hypothetical protein